MPGMSSFPGGKIGAGRESNESRCHRYDGEVGYQARPGTIGQNIKLVKTIGGTRLRIGPRSEFSCDSKSGVKRVPPRIARASMYGSGPA